MALALAAEVAGSEVAQAIQLGIEYDPQPPFAAGSPRERAARRSWRRCGTLAFRLSVRPPTVRRRPASAFPSQGAR